MKLYQSNRLEKLFDELCRVHATPPDDPITPEIIVVQNPGMGRWLSQHIAREKGIAANLHFPLPATFIWDIFRRTFGELPDLSAFDRSILLWRILARLGELQAEPSMQEIGFYLEEDPEHDKRYQLAEVIADLFDQYQVYRPDMLLQWEQGKEHHWQAELWRQLSADDSMHRAALMERFIEANRTGNLQTDNLPERVCLFGINSLAPAYLEVLARISAHTELHIFHLSPCRQAWDDILPRRLLALKRQSWRERGLEDISGYFTSGNPLLASMGGLGREFFSQLMERDPVEIDRYTLPEPSSLLALIQTDILDLRDRGAEEPTPLDPDDPSIRFHCCHSPMREIQVLHDRLLDLFAADPDLKPADILVMAPDINRYASFVTGVFGSAHREMRIPWSIADQSRRGRQPVLDAFLALFELSRSRFTAPEVVALLENPAVLRRFGLTGEDFSDLRAGIEAAGVRWGLDRQQRSNQGRDDSGIHTWEFGVERLLLGYITGPLEVPFLEVMPCSRTLGDAPWLGSLAEFIRSLQQLQAHLHQSHPPADWCRILLEMVDTFFAAGDSGSDQEGLLILRETISTFADCCVRAGFNEPVSQAVLYRYFNEKLTTPTGGQAFLSGRVTFCNMVPMRSVPFKVIWLLGMNDMDYPRSRRPVAFDLMALNPRLGDRSRRDDDRYLFLEALLSSRHHLSISWVGRDQQENTALPPSVVVAELRDYIDRGWTPGKKEKEKKASELLTIEYPLQPFSRRCFNGNPKTASYAEVWLPALSVQDKDLFFTTPMSPPGPERETVDIIDLVRFWKHPVRFFLQQRLGLQLNQRDDVLAETEAFSLNSLEKYRVSGEILSALLAEEDPAPLLHRLQAAGTLPREKFGQIVYRELQETTTSLALELKPLTEHPVPPCEVDLRCMNHVVIGWLNSLYSRGRIRYRPAKFKPQDLLQLWIGHLILCLLRPEGVEPISIHVATDTAVRFQPVADPEAELAPFLHYYQLGLTEPLHFYPRTSYAWAQAGTEIAAVNGARKAWYSSSYSKGEGDDPSYALALRGQDPLDTRFQKLATLFLPILESMEKCSTGVSA